MYINVDLEKIKSLLKIKVEDDSNYTYHLYSEDEEFNDCLKYLTNIFDSDDYSYKFKLYDEFDVSIKFFDEHSELNILFDQGCSPVVFTFDLPDEETAFYFKLKYH